MLLTQGLHAFGQDASEAGFLDTWLTGLSERSSPAERLAGALVAIERQPSHVAVLLSRPMQDVVSERLRLGILYSWCRDQAGHLLCADDPAVQLQAADPDNAEPYLYTARDRLQAGEPEAALDSLRVVLSAGRVDPYFVARLMLLREVLGQAGYPGHPNNAAETHAGALPLYGLYATLHRHCREQSRDAPDWRAACLALGRTLVQSGRTVVQQIHGYAIQRDAFGDSPQDQAAKAVVEADMQAYNAMRDRFAAALPWISSQDFSTKPDVVYDDTVQFGEFEAMRRALQRRGEARP